MVFISIIHAVFKNSAGKFNRCMDGHVCGYWDGWQFSILQKPLGCFNEGSTNNSPKGRWEMLGGYLA